ncbi:MAG TPA: 3-phosphoshikimate 1-carboxyvinyltransferase [Pyrinomonadaceae bacterium]|nr:3-phosphoshikimate 1-carboxyvinyltransferase [Pyrinomonadaceae bacterium]
MKIRPARRLAGHLPGLPGDKSVSHRAALVAALARGRSVIENYSTSEDCAATLRCLAQLGARIERTANTVVVEGVGAGEGDDRAGDGAPLLHEPSSALDCGNSGTTMRLLAGVLAAHPFASTLTGDASLRTRPMRRIIAPLELMGARVRSVDGRAPLHIEGRRPLAAVRYELPVASAQVKSCVLLAGLCAQGRTTVVETEARTRDHTERVLRHFGVPLEIREDAASRREISVEGLRGSFAARDFKVPGDISSAAFLFAAAMLLPGSDLRVEGVGLNPTRTAYLERLRALGGLRLENVREECAETVGDVRVRGVAGRRGGKDDEGQAERASFVVRGAEVAELIDELPLLAVVGSQLACGAEIRGAGELRVKESDRISATVENLRAMGAEVTEYEDGLRVVGGARLRGARLDARGDHRIAMAFSVAALVAEGETEIIDAEECVGVSFPEFFKLLDALVER